MERARPFNREGAFGSRPQRPGPGAEPGRGAPFRVRPQIPVLGGEAGDDLDRLPALGVRADDGSKSCFGKLEIHRQIMPGMAWGCVRLRVEAGREVRALSTAGS